MTDSILIVGAGIAGLHAAMACTDAGARAIVVERNPIVGGKLAAAMTNAEAIGNRAEGKKVPLFEALADNDKIEIITNAELSRIEGRPGNFTASIRERARFVTDDCTRCNLCRAVCPVVLNNQYDAGLTYRKAIYTPMAETLPEAYVIDIENCLNTPPNYLPCNRCIEVCDDDAIHFDQALETFHERHVGAVILAPGFRVQSGEEYSDLGYNAHPDIVTSAELQRLLESPGPTGGFASKPSNEEYPESALLVLDDPSQFALYIVASQVHQLIGQDIDRVAVLVLSQPPGQGEFEQVKALSSETGVSVHWGAAFKVTPGTEDMLDVSYEDFTAGKYVEESFEMVVLCTDVEPPEGLAELAETAGVGLADTGYLDAATAREGIFLAGCATGPKNIKDSIADAKAAADAAIARLDPRLLESDAVIDQVPRAAAPSSVEHPDDMRARIEKLLYALIDQPR